MMVAIVLKRQKVWLSALLLVLFITAGCSRINDGKVRGRHAITVVMDKAESAMSDNPAGACMLMSSIDSLSVRGRAMQARYALLYTESQFKNYARVTSDSLIMVAVRHYSIGKDLMNRFKSYYYLGCVYAGLGRISDAVIAFSQAEQLVEKIDDGYWHGLLYTQLGSMFNGSYDFKRAEGYFRKAEHYYELAGKDSHRVYALYDIAYCKMGEQDYRAGDSIMHIVQDWAQEHNDNRLYADCIISRLSGSLYSKESENSQSILENYISLFDESETDPSYLKTLALYYNKIGDYDMSNQYLSKAWECDLTTKDSINLYYASSMLEENLGHTKTAFDNYRKYISLQNESVRSILSHPILGVQNELYKTIAENEMLRYNHVRMTLILCVVILLLVIFIVIGFYHYNKQRVEKQLDESMAVVEELTDVNHKHTDLIEKLREQVRSQFHERHDMSNRICTLYFDSDKQERVSKQQLNVAVKNIIKDYTAAESVRKLDSLLNESYDGIMDRLSAQDIGMTEKEKQLLRYSLAGLSSKTVSVILDESPQNVYQLKSRLLKKVRCYSEDLWMTLSSIW